MSGCGIDEDALRATVDHRMRAHILIRSVAVPALIVLALMFCVDARSQRKSNQTAEVFGVVNGADGALVVLHLRAIDENPVRYYDGYEETAAKDGSFHFASIAPGAYQLETDTSGFTLPVPQPIELRAGESRRGVTVSVTPSFSLCGRVTENGAPKDDTWVNAYRYNPEFGTLTQTFVPHLGPNGSIRVPDLAPGLYYLQAYTTYYPGSFSFNAALPIIVGAGTPTGTKNGCALEIPLQYTGCSSTKVSGRITSVPGDDNAKYKVLLLAPNPAGGSMPAPIAMNINDVYKPGDTFSTSVCQGNYDLVLSDDQQIGPWSEYPSHKVVFDIRRIEVGATAIDAVELAPQPMASISGEVPGMTHNVSCPAGGPRAHVSILREGDGQFQSADLDDKNRFTIRNVAPGAYTVYVGPFAREAFFLDSILLDGKPIKGRKFTVAQPQPMSMVINISGDLAYAAGHLSPDVRRESRWEVAWTRPKGTVAGKVLGVSEAGTTLKLQAVRYNSNASAEYTAHVDTDGSFLFNAVDPGVYTLRAEGQGIVTTEYGALKAGQRGTPIVIARDAHIRGLTLSPPKLSSICGRVTDPEGRPLAGARIFLQWNHGGAVYGGPPGASEVLTDSDGRFRFDGLSPGEYFPASPLDMNRTVFFSPDGNLRAATPVLVQVGKDVGCAPNSALNLSVPANYKKEYSFAGKTSGDLPASIGNRFWVSLFDARASGAQSYVATAKLDAEHRFSFDKIPGGEHLLQLYSAYGPEPMTWSGPYGPVSHLLASQTIDVRDDMSEVIITPMQLPTVTGTVHFNHVPEAWKNNFQVANQKVMLVPRQYSAPFSAQLSADGSFSIGPENVGDYEVNLDLRGPLYLQSVRLDGREIKGRYIHLSAETLPKLEIEVSGDSGQVNAHVVPDASLPAAEPSVDETCSKSAWPQYEVVLLPDPLFDRPIAGQEPNAASVVQPRLLRSTRNGDEPANQLLQGVPPGHYRALALQAPGFLQSPFGRRDGDTGFEQKLWNALAALGKPVTVQAGGTVELALPDKIVDADRLAAKLGLSLDHGLFDW